MDAELRESLRCYIDDHFVPPHRSRMMLASACCDLADIKTAISTREETFSEMLFRLIKEKNISEVECYKGAGLSRQLFSKIRSSREYNPSRNTAIALAISLHLSLDETDKLLRSAGFALSHSSRADLIIEYFIVNGDWRLMEINEALYSFGESPVSV